MKHNLEARIARLEARMNPPVCPILLFGTDCFSDRDRAAMKAGERIVEDLCECHQSFRRRITSDPDDHGERCGVFADDPENTPCWYDRDHPPLLDFVKSGKGLSQEPRYMPSGTYPPWPEVDESASSDSDD